MISCNEFLNKAKHIYECLSLSTYSYACVEMDYRECARTAYYYVFHKAAIRAGELPGDADKSVGSHQRVIDKLLNSAEEKDKNLGLLLVKMRPTRVKADYSLGQGFSKNEAYKALRLAEKLLAE